MVDLSLHILDIVQNSIRAEARLVRIFIFEQLTKDMLTIRIEDDGRGMNEEMVSKVINPFYTTRKTRKVGLGIPLLKQNAEMCDGTLHITSKPSKGTMIEVFFKHSHIDRPPLGDIASTMKILIAGSPTVDFEYHHKVNEEGFQVTTKEMKETLEDISITDANVLAFIESMINENIKALHEM